MAQRRTATPASRKGKAGRDSPYEIYDAVVTSVLLMDGLTLLSAERRGDAVVFVFRSRPGLAAQVAEVKKIGEECEAASREVEARTAAALASTGV